MADEANHFVLTGAGIEGTVDLGGITGSPLANVTIDGRALRAPAVDITRTGVVVSGIHEEVPDDHTLIAEITIPQVNLDSDPVTCAGFAVLVTARTSIGGPRLVSGPLQLFDLRPVAVCASIVDS